MTAGPITVGAEYYDAAYDTVGVVADVAGMRVWLRPPGGGLEWDTLVDDLHPPADAPTIRARRRRRQAAMRAGLR